MTKICFYGARYSFESLRPTPLGNRYIAAYLIQQKISSVDEICIAGSIDEVLAFEPDILIDPLKEFRKYIETILNEFVFRKPNILERIYRRIKKLLEGLLDD